jgi:O-antigen/teichoic acid export membrane protein
LGVNVVYSLVSIPLILHWLPRAEFGIWVLLGQLMSYLSLVDLGMTAAVARLLVDHKEERANGNYGSLIKTAFLVSVVQGALILSIITFGSPVLAALMKIPPENQIQNGRPDDIFWSEALFRFMFLFQAQGGCRSF